MLVDGGLYFVCVTTKHNELLLLNDTLLCGNIISPPEQIVPFCFSVLAVVTNKETAIWEVGAAGQ